MVGRSVRALERPSGALAVDNGPEGGRRDSAGVAVGATLGAAFLWGTSFNVNDHGLAFVGPATFVVLRFALAGLVTVAAAAWMRRLDARLLRWPFLWLMAGANGVGFLLQYVAQTFTTPARTALFVNSSAFAVALLERVFFGERVGPRRAAAILVGFLGAFLLLTGGDPAGLRGGRLLGDALALAAGLAWSVFFVMNRRAVQRHDPVGLTGWVFVVTSLMLLPSLLLDARPLHVPVEGVWPVAYAGVATTALAYGLWTFGLKRIRATTSAVLLLFEILVASLLSLALGRETFGAVDVVGALLLVAAVVGMGLLAGGDEPSPDQER